MKYGLLFVDKTGVISPEISETGISGVNVLNAAKEIIFIALSYFKKLIKRNFDGTTVT